MGSKIYAFFPVICGKNAENLSRDCQIWKVICLIGNSNEEKIRIKGYRIMRSEVMKEINKALLEIDQEIKEKLQHSEVPDFCGFLDIGKVIVQVEDEMREYSLLNDRAVFPIELFYGDLNQKSLSFFNDYIKKKMNNKNLEPLRNQEGKKINKSEILEIKWIEFLRNIDSNFMINYMISINGQDSFQIFCAVYF